MKTTEDYLNFKFEFFDDDTSEQPFEKLDGPGDLGDWLIGPDSPNEFSIFPLPYTDFIKQHDPDSCFRVVGTPLSEDLTEEFPDKKEEMTGFEIDDIRAAQQIAKENNCPCFYWIMWDGERYIFIINSNTTADKPIDGEDTICYARQG